MTVIGLDLTFAEGRLVRLGYRLARIVQGSRSQLPGEAEILLLWSFHSITGLHIMRRQKGWCCAYGIFREGNHKAQVPTEAYGQEGNWTWGCLNISGQGGVSNYNSIPHVA